MAKRMSIAILLLVLTFGGLIAFNLVKQYFIKQYFSTYTPPPVTVTAVIAKTETIPTLLTAIGTLEAANSVKISSDNVGKITEIGFESGEFIEKNRILVRLDDRIEQADLQHAKAELKLASLNYDRQQKLLKTNSTPSSLVDEAKYKLQEAEAAVIKIETVISQKTIRAPIAGKAGFKQIHIGEYITPGSILLTLQTLDPLTLTFHLPEKNIPQLQIGEAISITVDGQENQRFKGTINAIDSQVNTQTHTIAVEATIANSNQQLYPGLFAKVLLNTGAKQALTIPQTAVNYSLYGNSVFVVIEKTENGKKVTRVEERQIKTGDPIDNKITVISGLNAGEKVVAAGQVKLQPNAVVAVKDYEEKKPV